MITPDTSVEGLDIKGSHPAIRQVLQTSRRVASTDSTVLITGESGTGKEMVARYVHAYSRRATEPFVAVNCAAIGVDLLESEMFGHSKGAFTGALAARMGLFQLANGGTMFLDEIGEMPAALQVKLLRVLQDREIRPVGTDHSIHVDVRVIAATKLDLSVEMQHGHFREDLFYRLQVIPITMPPLRERRSDVPLLVQHFLDQLNSRRPTDPVRIDPVALEHLWEYDWPGNVRELQTLIERLSILSEDGIIHAEALPPAIQACHLRERATRATLSDQGFVLPRAVEAFEQSLILEALRRTNGNKSAAARLLGVKRPTLVAKLARGSLNLPSYPPYRPPARRSAEAA